MANFRDRKIFETREPELTVDAGLPVGSYKFQLVIKDDNGNISKPAEVVVDIVNPDGPGPYIRPRPIRIG